MKFLSAERQDFIAKLAVLVPAPRAHLTRYHGILGPSAAWRSQIVPTANPISDTSPDSQPLENCFRDFEDKTPVSIPTRPCNYTWSELMKRVFLMNVLQCEICGGAMKIIAAIHPPDTTRRILETLGLPTRPPPLGPAIPDAVFPIDSF